MFQAQRTTVIARLLSVCILTTSCLLSGCATVPQGTAPQIDPYEGFNRKVFKMNIILDGVLLRPIAVVYQHIVPAPVNKGITNFFHNLHEISNIANDMLQGKFLFALSDAWRFTVNSTVGLLGFFDVASPAGLTEHNQDFGVTLATWGYKDSAFLMLPIFGPTTVRDALSMPVDQYALSAWPYIDSDKLYTALYATKTIDRRASLLPADQLIRQSFDPYIFVRNAYLQRRQYLLKKRLEHASYKGKPNPLVHPSHTGKKPTKRMPGDAPPLTLHDSATG